MRSRGLWSIHAAVLLFGVAGLFGKILALSPQVIVWGRTLFASLFLCLLLPVLKIGFGIKRRADLLGFVFMGAVLALHWVTFFHAIQISTVAIGLLTFATFPIFVTFLEPFFFAERIRLFDLIISAIVFLGLALVLPEFDLSNRFTLGVLWGTFSGFTFAILSVLNRVFVANYPALKLTFYQNAVACLLLFPIVTGSVGTLSIGDFGQLALLGVVFTALAHSLFVRGMRTVKAQLASIISSLEPVYGILLALALLGEVPSLREILGGGVILAAIVLATKRKRGQTQNVKI